MTHHPVTAIGGVVTAPDGMPMNDVLVEVYGHPEVVMSPDLRPQACMPSWRRLRFEFANQATVRLD